MNPFWRSDTYRIVQKMKASGNQPGVIEHWKGMVERWAQTTAGADAEAVRAWLPTWQARDLYTAGELAPVFPALAVALGLSRRPEVRKSAARLANELRMASLPHRQIGLKTFYAVARLHHWSAAPDSEWEKEIASV